VESYDGRAPESYGAKSFSSLRGQSYAMRLAFFVRQTSVCRNYKSAFCSIDKLKFVGQL